MAPAVRLVVLLVLTCCCGCGSYFTSWGHDAATGAIDAVTNDNARKRVAALTTDAVKAAREEALGPTTDAELQRLVTAAGDTAKAQLNTMVVQLTATLQVQLRQMVRAAINEALGTTTLKEVGALREEVAGPPLQKDIDALIDSASPHLTQAVQQAIQTSLAPLKIEVSTLKTDADAEAAKWKPIAIGFAIGCGFLLIGLIFGVYVLRSHRRIIESLLAQGKKPSMPEPPV